MSDVVSNADVMKLRQKTGAGIMECKKFLKAAQGDIEQAIIEMRKAGQTKADKKADRIAAEGIIIVVRSADLHTAVLLEVNSETDFAARDESFVKFANEAAQTALANRSNNIADLANTLLVNATDTVEQARLDLVAKIGENIKIRRVALIESSGVIGHYLHGSKIGVLVSLQKGDESLAKDLAMQVAASRPIVVYQDQVSPDLIAQEREIFMAQSSESGKPQAIIEKMIDGRLKKFVDEVSLAGQAFIKDPGKKVADLLKEKNAEVASFMRFEVGEGIEKKEDNFVAEVMAQVRES